MTPPTLVIIRGNSASGKTSTAREVQRRYGRGCALIEQDQLRRIVLREHDSNHIDPVAPAFITATVRAALDVGYHVVLEGILHTDRYATVLRQLIDTHPGTVPRLLLRRVLRRDRPPAPAPARADRLHRRADARVVRPGRPARRSRRARARPDVTLEQAITTIMDVSGLARRAPLTPARSAAHAAPLRPHTGSGRRSG